MIGLPDDPIVDVTPLSKSFRNVQNSYKFYWLLAILDHLKVSDDPVITFDDLSMRMLSQVWYPLDYFKLSFGAKDGFKFLAQRVSQELSVNNSVNAPSLLEQMTQKLDAGKLEYLRGRINKGLLRWVVYRFLSPFFESQVRGLKDQLVNDIIRDLSNSAVYSKKVPYAIKDDHIIVQGSWMAYFRTHQAILRGFTAWHLVRFLQKNNPNVIGLTEKLERPIARDLLLAKRFWSSYLKAEPFQCIYSRLPIPSSGFSLDHFVPWSYIAHDQVWNIIPTTKQVNSSKSDCLPNLETYSQNFIAAQYAAFRFHCDSGHDKLLEDYFRLFQTADLASVSADHFAAMLQAEFSNHYRVAGGLGFDTHFQYKG